MAKLIRLPAMCESLGRRTPNSHTRGSGIPRRASLVRRKGDDSCVIPEPIGAESGQPFVRGYLRDRSSGSHDYVHHGIYQCRGAGSGYGVRSLEGRDGAPDTIGRRSGDPASPSSPTSRWAERQPPSRWTGSADPPPAWFLDCVPIRVRPSTSPAVPRRPRARGSRDGAGSTVDTFRGYGDGSDLRRARAAPARVRRQL